MKWLIGAIASSWLFVIATTATFVPLTHPDGLEYVFVWPRTASLLIAGLAATLAIASAWLLVRRLAQAEADRARLASRDDWLQPLTLVGIVVLGIAPAAPGVGERGAILAYLFYDLRWWWLAGLTLWTVARADGLVGSPIAARLHALAHWPPASRRLVLESSLFALVLAWTFFTTPGLRFAAKIEGDEPKYLRYCELWYQGGGLDVSRVSLVSEQPLDAPPHLLQNLAHAAAVVPEVIRDLSSDLVAFVGHPTTFRWNRVRAEHGFATGKHGGIYQIHQPGVAATLMPGYVLDRYLIATAWRPDGKWPDPLPFTNFVMWCWAGLCAVSLFRLLLGALHSESLAWGWALVAMCSLPAAAFAFQFYPELPALWIILTGSRYVLFDDAPSHWRSAAAGAAVGSLLWFHPRFLLVALCLATVGMWRHAGRTRLVFAIATGLSALSFLVFVYHVSGSFLPTALWDANEQGVSFLELGFIAHLLGYGLDRTWGIFPHAPVFLAAVPGLAALMTSAPQAALFVGVMVMALVGPAAGHTLSAAGTTPDRLIVAVVPLLIWPVAVLVRRFWSAAGVRAVTFAGVVLSLDAALAYNGTHTSSALKSPGLSGWRPNLAFPPIDADRLWGMNGVVLAGYVAGLLLVTIVVWRSWRGEETPRPHDERSGPRVLATVGWLTTAAAAAWLSTGVIGDWTSDRFLLGRADSHLRAVSALLDQPRCRICFSSRRAQMDWKQVRPNSATGVRGVIGHEDLRMRLDVIVDGAPGTPAFGRARIDFGDGTAPLSTGVVGIRTLEHQFSQAGTYKIIISFEPPVGPSLSVGNWVTVRTP